MQPGVRATISNGGINTITAANGTTLFALRPYSQQEGVRRNTRPLHDGEVAFAVFRSDAAAAAVLAAAAARSYHTDELSQHKSFPSQVTHPSFHFVLRLMQHLEGLHLLHNVALGLPETEGKCATPSGTAQLRYASDKKPPPEFDRKTQARGVDSGQVALSTQHTDRAQADRPGLFPELFHPGAALHVPGAGGMDVSSTDDSDGGEHSSYTDTCTTWRAVANCGDEPISMWLSLPKYEKGVHMPSSSPTGVHEQFRWQQFELNPGDVFAFKHFAGVVLKHQVSANKLARGVCFSVLDYCFVEGARDVHHLVTPPPPATPWPWEDAWRIAPQSAHAARGAWGGAPCDASLRKTLCGAMPNDLALTPLPLPCAAKIAGAMHCPLATLARLHFKDNAAVVYMLKMGNFTDAVKQAIQAGQVACGAARLALTLTLTLALPYPCPKSKP